MIDNAGTAESLLLDWLLNAALPFWAGRGVDRRRGGFFEKIDRDGRPMECMRRARLVSRQIYCFATAHALGWGGAAPEIVEHGLDFLLRHLVMADGTVCSAVSADGEEVDGSYDPYDYAFVLFGLAAAARVLAPSDYLATIAGKIRGRLVDSWKHPELGFEQGRPRTLPLRANPHMHLLEAFLSWEELGRGNDPLWGELANEIVELAVHRLIAADTGALPEHFDGDWRPLPDARGLLVEPGHQFEWAWLLARWAAARSDERVFAAAVRLAELGEAHGTDEKRGVAINELDGNLHVRDSSAKLWPQAERVKAWRLLAGHSMSSAPQAERAERLLTPAIAGLQRYLDGSSGMWRESMNESGTFDVEPVKASSLYHLTSAIEALATAKTGRINHL
jgi:mannose/cellobiose epimerase-like protein (N-acyl-D-glucosamine 2-epimerase family)